MAPALTGWSKARLTRWVDMFGFRPIPKYHHHRFYVSPFGAIYTVIVAILMLGWMSQMQFQIPDPEIFFAYLERYIAKYEGRGLPTPLDESLLAQVHRTA